MNRLLFLLILFHVDGFGQTAQSSSNKDSEKVYALAITDFIKDLSLHKRINIDTLFIRKRINEEEPEDNFPDIQLPESIEKICIRLISPAVGDTQQKTLKHRVYLNLFGWMNDSGSKFDFFVFSNGFEYQFNYHIEYNYNSQLKKYELTSLKFQGPPFDK